MGTSWYKVTSVHKFSHSASLLSLSSLLTTQFNMRFASHVGAVALLASTVFGHPRSTTTSRSGLQRRVIDLNAFRLKTIPSYTTPVSTDSNATPILKREDWLDTASSLVKATVPNAEFRLVDDHYIGVNGIAHANFKQMVHGLDIDNADFNVNVRFSL